jgi:hypothetical protein
MMKLMRSKNRVVRPVQAVSHTQTTDRDLPFVQPADYSLIAFNLGTNQGGPIFDEGYKKGLKKGDTPGSSL